MTEIYPVILLLGGFGSRLKSISNGMPKALMKVGDGVFLDILINNIIRQNVGKIYLSTFYRSDLFDRYRKNSNHRDKIFITKEPEPLGTGGAINYVVETENILSPFFVINGDSISNINLYKMYKKFEEHDYKVMIGASEVNDAKRYGNIVLDNGNIISFNEKGTRGPGWINNGHYIFDIKAFDGYHSSFSLEIDLLPNLVKKSTVGVFKVKNDNFIDIGIPDQYNKIKKGIL